MANLRVEVKRESTVYKNIPTLTHEFSLKPGRLNYSNGMV